MAPELTPAQAILLVGGLASLTYSTFAGFLLYWLRMRDVSAAQPRYAIITHTSAITSGVVLLGLSVAVLYSGFTDFVNVVLAILAVVAAGLSAARNTLGWFHGHVDGMADVSAGERRIRGVVNVLNLVVVTALLYGVARVALGI